MSTHKAASSFPKTTGRTALTNRDFAHKFAREVDAFWCMLTSHCGNFIFAP